MAAFVYEGVLLFGVAVISGYLWSTLTQQRHALHGRLGLQAFMFLVFGIYFVWFWSHGGQTLAMKTWGIKLLKGNGHPVSQVRALARYVISWVWFIPALALAYACSWHRGPRLWVVLLGWIFIYALTSRLQPQRKFWHDVLCGTQLVQLPKFRD